MVGAFNLLPVALLYLALPLAVRPPPFLTDNFSPLPTERLGFFLGIVSSSLLVNDEDLAARLSASNVRNAHVCPPVKLTDELVITQTRSHDGLHHFVRG